MQSDTATGWSRSASKLLHMHTQNTTCLSICVRFRRVEIIRCPFSLAFFIFVGEPRQQCQQAAASERISVGRRRQVSSSWRP